MTPPALNPILPGTAALDRARSARLEPVEQAASFSQTLGLSVQALATTNPVPAADTNVAGDDKVPAEVTEHPAVDPMALLLAAVQVASATAPAPFPMHAAETAAADSLDIAMPLGLNLSPAMPGAAAASMTTADSGEVAAPRPFDQRRGAAPGASPGPASAVPVSGQAQPADSRAALSLLERAPRADSRPAPASRQQASGSAPPVAPVERGSTAAASAEAALLAAAAPGRARLDAASAATEENTPPRTPVASIVTRPETASAPPAAVRRVLDSQRSGTGQFAQAPATAAGRVARLEPASADHAPVDVGASAHARGEPPFTTAATAPVAALAAAPAAPGSAVVASIPHVAPAVGSEQWAPALAHQLAKLAPGRAVELHLNPQELGPLKVTLTMADSRAQLAFTSDHAAVRQALEAALPQLRASFADSGINLGQATVGHGSGSSAGEAMSQHGQGRPQGQPEPRADRDRAGGMSGAPERRAAPPLRSGGVDTFA